MKFMNAVRLVSGLLLMVLTSMVPLQGLAAEGKESAVHDQMEAISRAFRKLNRQYADPAQKASSLELVASMQKHAETAKTLTPSNAVKLSGDEQSKYLATFHKDIDELLRELTMLKNAIANDKTEVTKAEVEKIGKLRNASHKELGVQFDDDRKRTKTPSPQGQ